MATETVKDYLGHPCQIAQAFDDFDDAVDEARAIAAGDRRELARKIGKALNQINKRLDCHHGALRMVGESLVDMADADGPSGVIAMADAYSLETCNKFYDLAGLVLVALEQGQLVQSPSRDTCSVQSPSTGA